MRKIEKTIYKFEELEKEVQEELIEKERDYQRDSYCESFLYDDMKEKASDLINDYFGITSDYLKVYYDLSYSQGSGAMVEFNINIEDLNKKYNIFSNEELRFLTDKGIVSDVYVRHFDNMYYHEYTFTTDIDFYNEWDYEDIKEEYNITEEEYNTMEDRLYELVCSDTKHYTESPFIKDIISMNKELGKYGYSCLEYYWDCDDSEMIQFLNEDEYYENGSVYMGGE